MSKNYVCIWIKAETKDKLRKDCRDIWLKYHPEFAEINLTDHFMVDKVVARYIEDDR